ncbi:MAG TPA: transposase domain-containing protein [Longimicrobium sp.]|jgi:hypothetical protein
MQALLRPALDVRAPQLYMHNPERGKPAVEMPGEDVRGEQSQEEFFGVAHLAGAPGLPATKSGVIRRAERDGWRWRTRRGQGGGREYHISSLPAETRAHLILKARRASSSETPAAAASPARGARAASSELWAQWEAKPPAFKEEAERRLNVLVTVDELVRGGATKSEAYAVVAMQAGESVSTVRRWIRSVAGAHQGDWLPLLAPRWTGRTAFAEYDERVYQWFRDLYLSQSQPPATRCYERVQEIARKEGLTVPSVKTLMRELERREDPVVIALERFGERHAAEMYPYLQRDRSGFRAMEALNVDGHKLDLDVVWPDGERVRAVLIAFQDLYSGMIVGWRLAKAETAFGMGLAFLEVCDRYGVCEHLWVDNTLAMASKKMTAGATGRKRFRDREGDPVGVMPKLGVKVHFTMVAHGQSKPIERAFGDLATNRIAKHPAFEGAYLGRNTVSKPENYGTKTVPVAEVERITEQEVLRHNQQLRRRTEVCAGERSFQAAFEASYGQHAAAIRRLTPAQRRLLFLMSDRVTVDRRDACVKLFGNRYWSEDLLRFRGSEVVVRYHPVERTLHDAVYVYGLGGDFIAEVPCYHAAGFADAEAAQRHNRARSQHTRQKKKLAQASRHLEAAQVAALVPQLAPPPMPQLAGDVVRVDFAQPSTLDRIATILPADPSPEEAQARVNAGLARVSDELGRALRAG